MKIKTALGISLFSLWAFSNSAQSQNSSFKNVVWSDMFDAITPHVSPKDTKDYSGVELGWIINQETKGGKVGFYYANSKFKCGFVAEINKKGDSSHLGVGVDKGEVGIEASYYPTNTRIIRPYGGLELGYRGERRFVGIENVSYTKKGIGLKVKCGTDIKPFKNYNPDSNFNSYKVRPFVEIRYEQPLYEKKSKGYPINNTVNIGRFSGAIGIKF